MLACSKHFRSSYEAAGRKVWVTGWGPYWCAQVLGGCQVISASVREEWAVESKPSLAFWD